MKKYLYQFFISRIFFSFPIQLLINHIKKNQLLLGLWLILLLIVNEGIGTMIGIPSLFLEPEYQDEVGFWSFFLMGITLGVFTISFHITSYILDAPKFSFVASLKKPFAKFLMNNSLLPVIFFSLYTINIIVYQSNYEPNSNYDIFIRVLGMLLGLLSSFMVIFLYFVNTNMDIFKLLAKKITKQTRRAKIVRVNVMQRYKFIREKDQRVDYYFNLFLKQKKIKPNHFLDSAHTLQVFNQNHLNAVIIQISIFVLILVLGSFRDYEVFQIPAGASLVLLFTILLMFIGALSYWLKSWAVTATIFLLFALNFLMGNQILTVSYQAYGMNYENEPAEYSLRRVKSLSSAENYAEDKKLGEVMLENWRKKFPKETKPKMIFICVSGGGQRAAVWTMRTLQVVDKALQGNFFNHSVLITGASGGMVGASYFRELYLQKQLDSSQHLNIYDEKYLDNIARDNLNAIVFSLVVNDLFFGAQTFKYQGKKYFKDRGYAFEETLNKNTEAILDKSICEYHEPELLAQVPMLLLTPTIVNDGRKLYISAQNVSYMTIPDPEEFSFLNQKVKGIEFLRFFQEQDADQLRFLTALRMNATFPYVTPNVKLPSEPKMEIMDAGVSDNFGVSDAVRFVFTFRDWIEKNTSGVVFVSIRDTQKDKPIETSIEQSFFQRIFTPVASLFTNFEYVQDINNDNVVEFAQSWFKDKIKIDRVMFQYVPISKSLKEIEEKKINRGKNKKQKDPFKVIKIERAALSWRLTDWEKENIKRTIYELRNISAIRKLKALLGMK